MGLYTDGFGALGITCCKDCAEHATGAVAPFKPFLGYCPPGYKVDLALYPDGLCHPITTRTDTSSTASSLTTNQKLLIGVGGAAALGIFALGLTLLARSPT